MSGAQPSKGQPSESANSELVFRRDSRASHALSDDLEQGGPVGPAVSVRS